MKYRNENTGFILETDSEVKAEGWVKLNPLPDISEKMEKEVKPKKRTKNNDELCDN